MRAHGAVHGISADSVCVGKLGHERCGWYDEATRPFNRVLAPAVDDTQVFDQVIGPVRRLENSAGVDGCGIDQTNPRVAGNVINAHATAVKCRIDNADGGAPVNQHPHGILVEVDALEDRLLMSVVPDTVLPVFDANVRDSESRAATETNTAVSLATDGRRHTNLDILQLGTLRDTPPERCKGLAAGDVGGVEDQVL